MGVGHTASIVRAGLTTCICAGNIIITPYSGSQELFSMVRGVDADKTPVPSERTKLVFFRGHCGPWENVAKRMRHAMVGALRQGNSSEVDACCLGRLAIVSVYGGLTVGAGTRVLGEHGQAHEACQGGRTATGQVSEVDACCLGRAAERSM